MESADLEFICGASVTVLIGDQDVVYSHGSEAAVARARIRIPNVRTQFLPGASREFLRLLGDPVVAS